MERWRPILLSEINLWRECNSMPFLFKLAKRMARLRARAVLLTTAIILAACDSTDQALSGPTPTHPSFATATGLPAEVTDLAVAAMTDTSAILTFAEVDDGTGAPASYDIRVAPTPLVWSGTGRSVTRGTCATPFAGAVISATRVCSVLGLTAGTSYDFRLVAFRGTLNLNAVFGPLSNVASGTAQTPVAPVTTAPATVTDLEVAGATDTVITLSFTEVTDGSGRPATYDVRYVAGSTLTCGASVPSVSRRTCAAPVAGTAIGAWRTCTVAGLTVGTTYSFELVAYRGTLKVDAVFGALSNVATGTAAVTPPPPLTLTAPGTVTDLKVTAATDTTVTLAFTEVNDGSGHPSSYDIRYVAGSTIAWGSTVPSVTRGTCAKPVAGTAFGVKRTCTMLGVTPASAYTFQLVAFRGTLNVNAVFGGLSNIASGTTTGTTGGSGGGGGGGVSGGTVLLQENFADAAFAARGWYDNPDMPVTSAQHMPGATSALEIHMPPGAVYAQFGSAARHTVQPTSTLYISYWVKYSANWVGSASMDHP